MIGLACVVLLGLAILSRWIQGSWFAPAPLLALYWSAWIAATLAFSNFDLSPGATWAIVGLVASWAAGSLSAAPSIERQPRALRMSQTKRLRLLVGFGSLAGVAAALVAQHVNGVSLSQFVSLGGLMDAGSTVSLQRYGGEVHLPFWVPLLLAFNYAAAILAPLASRQQARFASRIAWMLAPLVGSVAYSLATTARAAILTSGVLLAAGWIASHVLLKGALPRITRGVLLTWIGAVIGGIALFLAIGFVRVGSQDPRLWPLFLERLQVYLFGFLPAFGHWLPAAPAFPFAWGSASFAGIAKYVGGNAAYSSAWSDFAPIGIGLQTNIYSAFRSLIVDFGTVFAPIAMFLGGFTLSRAWRSITRTGTPTLAPLLAAGYGWVLLSNTVGLFTFANTCFAIVIAWVALRRATTEPLAQLDNPGVAGSHPMDSEIRPGQNFPGRSMRL